MGYPPPHDLGKSDSQCFEYRWQSHPVLMIGFRDLAQKDGYSAEGHLWVEGLAPIVRSLTNILRTDANQFIPPAFAVVIDNIDAAYTLVPLIDLVTTYELRDERMRAIRQSKRGNLTFAVKRTEDGYALETPRGYDNIPLPHRNTFDPLLTILRDGKNPQTRVNWAPATEDEVIQDRAEARDS